MYFFGQTLSSRCLYMHTNVFIIILSHHSTETDEWSPISQTMAKTNIPLSVCLYFSVKWKIHPNIIIIMLLLLLLFQTAASDYSVPFCLLAISRALRQHTARSHTDQGQLCGAGGHCSHQGHFSQVPQQVSFLLNVNVVMCIFSKDFII